VQIDFEKLQALFDMAVGSSDFGSGFLDTEEVELLREVAVTIGADPMDATPFTFATQYSHPYGEPSGNPPISQTTGLPVERPCRHCDRKRDDSIHQVDGA
jgi:hypothetical protein